MDKQTVNRDKFLSRVARHKTLDALDKKAISEAILLDSLKSHQREADRLIGYYFKSRPI